MKAMIVAKNIDKFYKRKHVLKKINLQVPAQSIFGMLGPNGAGKTTFIKCLLHLVQINGGELTLQDLPVHDPRSRQHVAYLPERFNFYPFYSVEKTIEFFGRFYGLMGEDLHRKTDRVLERFNLTSLRKSKLKSISKGQVQRVGLAKLFMQNAEIFILDEPFSGLDPIGTKELKDLMVELKEKEHKTIFMNSHQLTDMEKMCDEISIMNFGEILKQGRIKDLCQTKEKQQDLETYFYDLIKGAASV